MNLITAVHDELQRRGFGVKLLEMLALVDRRFHFQLFLSDLDLPRLHRIDLRSSIRYNQSIAYRKDRVQWLRQLLGTQLKVHRKQSEGNYDLL